MRPKFLNTIAPEMVRLPAETLPTRFNAPNESAA
jgi:hypothetical protein